MNRIAWTAAIVAALLGTSLCSIGTLSPQASESQLAEHFRAGQEDLRQGNARAAVVQFRQVLRLAPSLSEARINLGLAYHLLGQYQLAAVELEDGLRQHPDLPGPSLILGIDELKLGAPSKAVPPLTRALELDPSNEQAGSHLGEAYVELGDYARAGRAYREAFKADAPGAWLSLGKAYLAMSSRATARIADEYADTGWAARLAGDFLAERGALPDAAERYRRALARDPDEPGLHESLGNVLLQQRDIDGARREFQAALRADPKSVQALLGLSRIGLMEGHGEAAIAYVSKIAQISPEFLETNLSSLLSPLTLQPTSAAHLARELAHSEMQPGTHILLTVLYDAAGDRSLAGAQRAAALSELQRLAGSRTPGADACEAHDYARCIAFLNAGRGSRFSEDLELGQASFALHRDEAASDSFASAVSVERNNPEALYWLVRADSAVADDAFSRLAGRFPHSAEARELEAETYRARGEDDKAIAQYRLAAALEPTDAGVREALGALYLKQHRLKDAEVELTQSLRFDPTNAEALYDLGRTNIGLDKPELAISLLERALRYDPSLLPARASLGIALLRAGKPALAVPELLQAQSLDIYGDLHYTLYQAYRQLSQRAKAQSALATSQSLRKKTEARDEALIQTGEAGAPPQ